MKLNDNRRLANVKSRTEVGLDYIMHQLEIMTPFGRNRLKEVKPFFPGQEAELEGEFDNLEKIREFVETYPKLIDRLQLVLMEMKDSLGAIRRSETSILSVVEIHEIKSLLLQMRQILKLTRDLEIDDSYVGCGCVPIPKANGEDESQGKVGSEERGNKTASEEEIVKLPERYILEDTEELLDILDPRKDRLNTFYIYDEFSDELKRLRDEKRKLELKIRKSQKTIREKLRREEGVNLTPKMDIVLSRSHPDFEKINNLKELEEVARDYMSVTLRLKADDEVLSYEGEIEELKNIIEEEEAQVATKLTGDIAGYRDVLLRNCEVIGDLELSIAKVNYAIKKKLVRPEIVTEHVIEFEDGRNLQVETILRTRGKEFLPVSIALEDGVTCITGANMGGKTISLKMTGQIALLAQYGFFVPARKAKVGLSNYMQILIGDSQSVERGLSSFGSEMEELKEIIDKSVDRSLILIDEIASGTNPVEGLALTRSVIDYLLKKPYISLITTHFETATESEGVVNMQVRGLAGVNFDTLDREIRYAKRKDRINIIGKYMDYRLYRVENTKQVPKDALNIAKMLGISKEIIDGAKKYIK